MKIVARRRASPETWVLDLSAPFCASMSPRVAPLAPNIQPSGTVRRARDGHLPAQPRARTLPNVPTPGFSLLCASVRGNLHAQKASTSKLSFMLGTQQKDRLAAVS